MSHQAVLRAVARGRLQRSVVLIAGRPHIHDVALADQEWAANTDLSRAPDAIKAREAARAERVSGKLPRVYGKLPVSDGKPQVSAFLDPQPHGGALKRTNAGEDDVPPDGSLATASAREKHFRAKLAELEYRERAGELVEAAAITAQLVDVITTCRTKLLGIPSKSKQHLSHLSLEDLATLDAIVREALEELVPPAPAEGAAA